MRTALVRDEVAPAVSSRPALRTKASRISVKARTWRMKVCAYKFKTQFDWSDWIQFRVDQH